MNQPIRIQRKRTAGFNLQAQSPDGRPVVSVCRPGRWGNPFKAGQVFHNNALLVGMGHDYCPDGLLVRDAAHAVALFRKYLAFGVPVLVQPALLRGKHLACFCALDAPCHADVLLEWANSPQQLWHRYDALWRKAGELTNAEKTELTELRALLVMAGVVTEGDF